MTTTNDTPTVTGQITTEPQEYGGERFVVAAPEDSRSIVKVLPERDENGPVSETTATKPLTGFRIGFEKMRSYVQSDDDVQFGVLLKASVRQFSLLAQAMLSRFMDYTRMGEITGYNAGPLVYRLNPGSSWGGNVPASQVSAFYRDRRTRALVIDGLRLEFTNEQWLDMIEKVTSVEVPMQAIPIDGGMITKHITYTISHSVEIDPDLLDELGEVVEDEHGDRFVIVPGTESEVNDLIYEAVGELTEEDLPDRYYDWDYYEQEDSNVEDIPEAVEYDPEVHGRLDSEEVDEDE